jgi:hypothetical protein
VILYRLSLLSTQPGLGGFCRGGNVGPRVGESSNETIRFVPKLVVF